MKTMSTYGYARGGIFLAVLAALGLLTTGLVQAFPTQLAITSVNGGVSPTAGIGFSVVVQSQTNGIAQNVLTSTGVQLSISNGVGTLSGTFTGTIPAGSNTVTISGVISTNAGTGVALTATRTSGDNLTPGNSAAFTVKAGAAYALLQTSGDLQSGKVGANLASPFVVTVNDTNGNPVSGTSVTFAVAGVPTGATGTLLSVTNATSDTNGLASSTLKVGNLIGNYTITATSSNLLYSPVSFTAIGTTNPTQLVIISVNGGLDPNAGTGFSVMVQSQFQGTPQNVLTNTAVTLSISNGVGTLGGTLTGTILAGDNVAMISGVTYTKAESGVVLKATRNSGDILAVGTSAPFTVDAGAATAIALTSGNNQSAGYNGTLANPFVVTVTDAYGNPVLGTSVTFVIATVPGGATGQSLSDTDVTTDGNGQAQSTLTLGNTTGAYTVVAESDGLSGSPVVFTASALAGPTKLAITSVNGGVSLTAGTPFSIVVQSQDNSGSPQNVLTDTAVTLSVATGTGTLGGILSGTILAGSNTATFSGITYTKAESGVVLRATRTSGDNLTAGNSITLLVKPGAAALLTLTSGNGQTRNLNLGATLPSAFVVTVTDAYGNPIGGTSVTFAIVSVPAGATGQSLSKTVTTSAVNGQASSSLTLGNVSGIYTVTATSAGLSGSPVTFIATAWQNIYSYTTGGNWSSPTTWSNNVVPTASDTVFITTTNPTPVICDINATCSVLNINSNCLLNIANDMTLTVFSPGPTGGNVVNNGSSTTGPGNITTGTGASKLLIAGNPAQGINYGGAYGNLEISNLVSYVSTPPLNSPSIASNCTLTVDTGAFLQQGNLNQNILGGGNFVLAPGATLGIKSATGITAAGDTNNGFVRVAGSRTYDPGANYIYNGTSAQTNGSGLPATVNSLTVSNAAGVTFGGTVTVSGQTMIGWGALSLGSASSFKVGSSLNILARGTLDVSGLGASATYSLSTNATLYASGTGIAIGVSAAAIKGGTNGTVSLGSQPIILTYDGSHPALYVSQGTLSLNGNAFTVNTTNAAPLSPGTYAIIQQAAGNIISNGTYTVSGTAIASGISAAIQVSGTNVNLVCVARKLVVTSVNGGVNPTAGTGFSVVVQAQGAVGIPYNVVTNTTVTLSLASGTGTLAGTLTGTILAGDNSVTISGVIYTEAESGVVLTATQTSGDILVAGNSAPFTVTHAGPTTLVLTSGNNQFGVVTTPVANPFVVTVTDAYGNPVDGISVTFAIASVPGGATGQSLSVTSATTAANGQASTILTVGNTVGTYTVTATSAGLSGSPVTFTVTGVLQPPTRLAITSVNGGVNPTAGIGFNVVVQSQDSNGIPRTVLANTTVTLSRTVGTGNLGGTLTGTILSGSNSVTISGVTYTKAESGVVLTATRTSGDTLTAGNSAPFTVNPSTASLLSLTSGNNQSGSIGTALTSPFVVTVTDAYGNPISGRSVTFAINTVPAGATGQSLSTTSTTTATNGQASSTLTLGSAAGTYKVTATSAGLSGSPVTFTATAASGKYSVLASSAYEYQVCFKCHSGYAWLPGSPPNGISPNGTATTPVMTDVAQEFSPMNKSGHPIVTGLNNYSNSIAPRGLGAAQLKAPWNINVGSQTMMCSDCHNTDNTNSVAAQGPHGSAYPFMLRVFPGGPLPSTWPAAATFAASWCVNCHNDLSITMSGHGSHHNAAGCYACHIVIPHGGKMSRLIGDRDGTMPARYAYNNTLTTMQMRAFTKSTGGNYAQSQCSAACQHSGGTENW